VWRPRPRERETVGEMEIPMDGLGENDGLAEKRRRMKNV
jgi:hypothetical protein